MNKNIETFKIEESIIDVSRYISALKKRAIVIMLISLLMASATYLVTKQMPPIYTANATILIEAKASKAVSIEEIVGIDSSQQEYYQTQYEIMRSNHIAEKVIKQFQLENNPEFNGENSYFSIRGFIFHYIYALRNIIISPDNNLSSSDSYSQVIQKKRLVLENFKNKLTISPIRKTQLVNISFESYSPVTSATLANAVGQAYIDSNIEAKLLINQEATRWISGKLEELAYSLRTSEAKLTLFQKEQGLVDAAGIDSLQTNELTYLTTQIGNARDRRLAAESLYTVLRQNKNQDIANLYAISEISNHPQIRDLRLNEADQEKQVSQLAKRYGPKHDKMIQAKAELKSIRERSLLVLSQLAKGIEKEYSAAKQQEQALLRELDSKKLDFQDLSLKRTEFQKLEREVINDRKLYDLFLTRQKETSVTSDYQAAVARITDHALMPLKPTKPSKLKIVIIITGLTMIILCSIVILRESVRNDLELAGDIEEKIGLSPIGSIPKLKRSWISKPRREVDRFLSVENSPFSEAVRSLRTRLLLNSANTGRKLFAVTSPLPAEGKSTMATNLALSLTKMERVIIIDADLRRPSLGKLFGLSMSQSGLSNYLLLDEELEACLYHDNASGLTVLPAGFIPPNPQELLGSKKFEKLLATLEGQFDKIIIDCPPAMVVSDALIIGNLTKALMLVVKAGSTKTKHVRKTLSDILNHDIKIDGVILNQSKEPSSRKSNAYYASYAYKASTKSS
ncbi:polysaccharide biosynthesis tyrosine autokinase [Vibrio sp. YMD68]|uniref:GumC family protein n=1 Tax=Vibrio sp. YMD68 TaxID=3042300 RepID=UPI00249C341C|nr:polysaccharide biosynthesis tyrosine autokinase [Vibrio sp. YMD68]WGV98430.1 polysaccharide biosynthesis tyrosine autokinase [Vibrio sp. YMD68]